MKERTQAFTELINRRIKVLAEQEPEKWVQLSDIAHQVGLALGRFYHPMAVSRLLRGQRGLIDPPEVAAWIKATGLDRDPKTEAEAWTAAGLLYPGAPVDAVQDLISAARRAPAPANTTATDQDADGRVRGSIRLSAPHLRLAWPRPAPSPIAIAVGALAPAVGAAA